MRARPSRSRTVVPLGLALALVGPSTGCDRRGDAGGTAAPISPQMKKKVEENLKGYPARAAARAQARRSKASP